MLLFFDTISILMLATMTLGALLNTVENRSISPWMRTAYIVTIYAAPWAIYRIVS